MADTGAALEYSGIVNTAILRPANGFDYLFKKINTANPDSAPRGLYYSTVANANLTVEDAIIDIKSVSSAYAQCVGSGSGGRIMTRRCVFKGTNVGAGSFLAANDGASPIIRMESCVVTPGIRSAIFVATSATGTVIEAERSTFYGVPIFLANSCAGWDIKNCVVARTLTKNSAFIVGGPAVISSYLADKESFSMRGNVFSGVMDIGVGQLTRNSYGQLPTDPSNTFVRNEDMHFVNAATWDFALSSGSLASRRGVSGSSVLVDINGQPFGSNDVGAIANAHEAVPGANISNKWAFVGDSIQYGLRGDVGSRCWQVFADLTGETVVDPSIEEVAVAGHDVDSCRMMADYIGHYVAPKSVMLSIGVNSLDPIKSNETAETMAGGIFEIIKTYREKYNIPAYWIGATSLKGSPPDNTLIESINTAVAALCESAGYTPYGSSLAGMKALHPSDWNTVYYDDLVTDLHPNTAGHAVIAETAEIIWAEVVKGIRFGYRAPFDSTLPTLALSDAAPGKLKSVQTWKKADVTKREIEKY